jgi:hypothetical protein
MFASLNPQSVTSQSRTKGILVIADHPFANRETMPVAMSLGHLMTHAMAIGRSFRPVPL